MAWSAGTRRAAVALGSCGNCGAKAVDQLVRQLVDEPRRQPPGGPPLRPSAGALRRYVGCFALPPMKNENRQPHRNASLVRVAAAAGRGGWLALGVSDGGGRALLEPFLFRGQPRPSPTVRGAAELGFTLHEGGAPSVSTLESVHSD
jgi:hypothetical protein